MINILDLDMHKNMENLLGLTTLTVDIKNDLHAWEESISNEAIV